MRILITGTSGSGTSTLGAALAQSLQGRHLDGDDCYWLPTTLRFERLRLREIERFGHADPAFLAWAAQYEQGPPEGRSLAKHLAWLALRTCPVLRLAGDLSVTERLAHVLECVNARALPQGEDHGPTSQPSTSDDPHSPAR